MDDLNKPSSIWFKDTQLVFYWGSILDLDASIIVSSDNTYLTMQGECSSAISSLLQKENIELLRKRAPIPLGHYVISHLKPKPIDSTHYIFHVAVSNFTFAIDSKQISKTTYDCLKKADELSCDSIAFPVFGSGSAGIPFQDSLNAIIKTITLYGLLFTSIKKIYISIHPRFSFEYSILQSSLDASIQDIKNIKKLFNFEPLCNSEITFNELTNDQNIMSMKKKDTGLFQNLLSNLNISYLKEQLILLMKTSNKVPDQFEYIYVDETLNLNKLTALLNKSLTSTLLYKKQPLKPLKSLLSSHQLSQLINKEYSMNFRNFVNKFRVIKAQELIKQKQHLSTLRIGSIVGFRSEKAFIDAYKHFYNITPGKFRFKSKHVSF